MRIETKRTSYTTKEGENASYILENYFSVFKLNVIFLGSKIIAAMKLKDTCSMEEKL